MIDPLLSFRDLRIAFGMRVVIRDLSSEVYSGDCVVVIGPNGSHHEEDQDRPTCVRAIADRRIASREGLLARRGLHEAGPS